MWKEGFEVCVRTVPEECLLRDLVLRNEETHDVKEMWTRHHVVRNRASQTDQLQVQGSGFRVQGLGFESLAMSDARHSPRRLLHRMEIAGKNS